MTVGQLFAPVEAELARLRAIEAAAAEKDKTIFNLRRALNAALPGETLGDVGLTAPAFTAFCAAIAATEEEGVAIDAA